MMLSPGTTDAQYVSYLNARLELRTKQVGMLLSTCQSLVNANLKMQYSPGTIADVEQDASIRCAIRRMEEINLTFGEG